LFLGNIYTGRPHDGVSIKYFCIHFLPGILQFLPDEPCGQEQTFGPTHLPSLHPPAHLAEKARAHQPFSWNFLPFHYDKYIQQNVSSTSMYHVQR
jgi:hypothetical protein